MQKTGHSTRKDVSKRIDADGTHTTRISAIASSHPSANLSTPLRVFMERKGALTMVTIFQSLWPEEDIADRKVSHKIWCSFENFSAE